MPTKIEWATESWNPITGCTPISEGCQHCYAKRMAQRLKGRYGYPKDGPFRVTFHPDRLEQPLRWKKPRMVFVSSMGDLFHDGINCKDIEDIFDVMRQCSVFGHTFMLLTKRPWNVSQYWEWRKSEYLSLNQNCIWPDNVWLGVTVESNKYLWRIEESLKIKTAVHFVNLEPMLGPVHLFPCTRCNGKGTFILSGTSNICPVCQGKGKYALDWVILGGETGPGARPMELQWARDVLNQCKSTGTPFFIKQIDSKKSPIPEDLMVREIPESHNLTAKH